MGTTRLPSINAWLFIAGIALLYAPTYWDMAHVLWHSDDQSHGPIILGVSLWLSWKKFSEEPAVEEGAAYSLGWPLLLIGLAAYAIGRSQSIWLFEAGSQLPVLFGSALLIGGRRQAAQYWFPIFFLLFLVPLPEPFVAMLTAPLKSAVSTVAATLIHGMGYPVAQSGVMLSVGQYQLLVADACAGLHSIFSLEALGLLYMNVMRYTSLARNVTLAIALLPVSFCANVTRVVILVLVTYYFGDEAGQGFVHGFAGMLLFVVALFLMFAIDKVLGLFFQSPAQVAHA